MWRGWRNTFLEQLPKLVKQLSPVYESIKFLRYCANSGFQSAVAEELGCMQPAVRCLGALAIGFSNTENVIMQAEEKWLTKQKQNYVNFTNVPLQWEKYQLWFTKPAKVSKMFPIRDCAEWLRIPISANTTDPLTAKKVLAVAKKNKSKRLAEYDMLWSRQENVLWLWLKFMNCNASLWAAFMCCWNK